MLKSKTWGGLWPGLGLMLATSLLLAACGGVGSDESQRAPVSEPVQAGTMAESAGEVETAVEELPVEEEPTAEAAVEAVAEEDLEVMPAEEKVLTETEDVAPTEMVETEPEPMSEETEMVETDESGTEMVGQDQVVESTEMKADGDEDMAAEVAETKPGPTEEQMQLLQSLKVLGSPAELHNEVWLNSEPLKLADLRGQVAIVEFWTFG